MAATRSITRSRTRRLSSKMAQTPSVSSSSTGGASSDEPAQAPDVVGNARCAVEADRRALGDRADRDRDADAGLGDPARGVLRRRGRPRRAPRRSVRAPRSSTPPSPRPTCEGWLPIAALMNLRYFVLTHHVPTLHPAGMFLLMWQAMMIAMMAPAAAPTPSSTREDSRNTFECRRTFATA